MYVTGRQLGFAYGPNVECKSWAADGIAFQKFISGESGAFKQFKTYLSAAPSMSGLEYWFDSRKISAVNARKKFQEMMLKNNTLTPQGNEIFDLIWANQSLVAGIWGVIINNPNKEIESEYRLKFEAMLSDNENSIFDFIKSK